MATQNNKKSPFHVEAFKLGECEGLRYRHRDIPNFYVDLVVIWPEDDKCDTFFFMEDGAGSNKMVPEKARPVRPWFEAHYASKEVCDAFVRDWMKKEANKKTHPWEVADEVPASELAAPEPEGEQVAA